MAKKGKPPVSGAGLTPADAKLLRGYLVELDAILLVDHMLGGAEAEQGFALQRRLKSRLDPENPTALAADAKVFTDLFGPSIRHARAEYKRREEARERYAQADAARRRAHNQEVARRQAELERKQQEAVESAIAASRGKM